MSQLERLKKRIPEEPDDSLLEDVLESAMYIILNKRFPFGYEYAEVEPRYLGLQVDIAEDIYNRAGASGQLQHSENGVSRSWGSEWVSTQLLNRIVPMVGKII